jgi:hypothetical protein
MMKWLKSLISTRAPARPAQRRAGFRPALETLEDRQLMSATVTAAGGLAGVNQCYVQGSDGSLSLYQGSTMVSQIVTASVASSHNGIAQVSAGVRPGIWGLNPSAPFVRFDDGTVNEYLQSGSTWSALNLCTSGASEISASQNLADDVFVRFGGWVEEHVGTNPDNTFGWNLVAEQGWMANLPVNGLQSFQNQRMSTDAYQMSVGYDATTGTSNHAVFVNFGGSLWEHTGTNWATSWKHVTDSVTGLSASQIQGDTVFALKSGQLWEYVGGVGTRLMDNVLQVSAGVDSSGHAAAFVLTANNILYEHTGMNPNLGWTPPIASGVSSIDAAQGSLDTVFYVKDPNFGSPMYTIWEHRGQTPDTTVATNV